MVKRLVTALLLITGLLFNAISQNVEGINARIDGMGGSGLTSDLGWAVGHPTGIANFPDQMQGTIYTTPIPDIGETYGAVIAVKGFGEKFRLGVTFNERIHMSYSFYKDGGLILDATHINGDNNADKFAMIPSVALCWKFNDDFKFGVSSFFEGQSYENLTTQRFKYPKVGGDSAEVSFIHNEIGKRISVWGFVAEAWLKIGGLYLRPTIKFGVPGIYGEEETDFQTQLKKSLQSTPAAAGTTFPDAINEKYSWECPEAMLINGGVLFVAANDNIEFDWGVWYGEKTYQFKKNIEEDTADIDASGNASNQRVGTKPKIESHRISRGIDYFIGVLPSFSDNFYFAPEYDGGFGWSKAKEPDIAADSNFFYMYHNFRLGIEKNIPDFWIFDQISFRSGLVAYWTKEWRSIKNGGFDGNVNSDENMPWGSFFWGSNFGKKQAKVAGGIGFKKARGYFDLSIDFIKWKQGIVKGPPSAMATIGMDFGRKEW